MTLHNSALVHMESDPAAGFKKLNFLLDAASPVQPPQAFANLLLLYCQAGRGLLDMAADVMAANPGLCASLLGRVRGAAGLAVRASPPPPRLYCP